MISDRALRALPKGEVTGLLRSMLQIRRFEEAAARAFERGQIRGFLHLYNGQEAIAAGVMSRLLAGDYVFSHHRSHGHALARGVEARRVMAELFGKAIGTNGGRGGSMHVIDVSRRFMGGYAVTAGHLPLACGTALACQRLGTNDVVLCFLGDGAVNEGAFHESLNLASIWKLPLLFVCENNFYSMGTPAASLSALTDIHRRAEAYGIRSEQIDGMDVIEVQKHAEEALQYIRTGQGPFFLEATTYRLEGHTAGDEDAYRERAEVEQWRALDPVRTFPEVLVRSRALSQDEVSALSREVEAEVEAAVAFADASPEAGVESLLDGVYAPSKDVLGDQVPPFLRRGTQG